MSGAQAALLPDGRLHLHHGPIDLIVVAEGPGRRAALRRAALRFETVLAQLVDELPRLRAPFGPLPSGPVPASPVPASPVPAVSLPSGPVARRMVAAVAPFAPVFVTPMAAVAGAVADEVLAAMVASDLTRAHVNNGGDVAFHLTPGTQVDSLIATDPPVRITVWPEDPVRGIATSGWRGRSHSLGIADTVTVLAAGAAQADAAATLIANAVDLPGHGAVIRQPACDLAPDSDLGDRRVTTAVGPLTAAEGATALDRGAAYAETVRGLGLIHTAILILNGQVRVVGPLPLLTGEREARDA